MGHPLLHHIVLPLIKDTTPARIGLTETEPWPDGLRPFELTASVLNQHGQHLAELEPTISVQPEGLVQQVGGRFRCIASGDALITFALGELRSTATVHCRLVKDIGTTHQRVLMSTGDPPLTVRAWAIDEQGRTWEDVPVEVVARHVEETRTLPDGETWTIPLRRGNHLVRIDTRRSRGRSGVTATWEPVSCQGQPEGELLLLTSELEAPATLQVTNPTLLGLGREIAVDLVVDRVPDGLLACALDSQQEPDCPARLGELGFSAQASP